MRKGYKLLQVQLGRRYRTTIDSNAAEIAETMSYGKLEASTAEEYLAHYDSAYEREVHAALLDLLDRERTIIAIGSGECEIEIPFFLEGYSIVGSDLVPEAFEPVVKLFPGFRARKLDIFHPEPGETFDDVLSSGGFELYYDNTQLLQALKNCRRLLKPGGRLILNLRMLDTWAIKVTDFVGMPLMCFALNVNAWLRRKKHRYTLRQIGYRRRRPEMVRIARQAGFRLGRVRYGGFGMEAMRFFPLRIYLPWLYHLILRADRKLCLLNGASIFEFHMEPEGGAAPNLARSQPIADASSHQRG